MTAVLTKPTFSDLQALKTRIHRHDKDLDILDKNLQNILSVTNGRFGRTTVTLNDNCAAKKFLEKMWNFMIHTLEHFSTRYIAKCITDTPNN